MKSASAHSARSPVLTKVPSLTLTRLSTVLARNVFRIPSDGSTACREEMELAQSGWERRVRVKRPVPEPILGDGPTRDEPDLIWKGVLR